ncbi:DEAD/DEAH box helicase [Aestuariivirga sp.]|uniref:DEAD/DEAH box helicase n=1 Tax=Aestuariivirga sp. TaxID=2650926 RepID=UPI003919FC8D
MTNFSDLQLSEPLLRALAAEGYEKPTPIQARAIPSLLEGKDLLGIAQTGTGKTAAFALPMLQRLAASPERPAKGTCRALILSPTRELAAQIADSFRAYGKFMKLSRAVVFGGVSLGKQIDILRGGVDILVATPGRLVDLIERRAVTLSKVEIFVLDEVDQMLDLGFIHAIRKITGMLPSKRQNLFFSATMPKEIAGLANGLLTDPVKVEVTPVATTAERVNQAVIHVAPENKAKLLAELLRDNNMTRTLVFTRTKHGADKVMKSLSNAGFTAAAIHGNKSQNNRERALAGFKAGKILVLVATDIAARGIDVDGVSHVVNYDLPHVPESYVHRIGRTARAGAEGSAIAFCTPDDRPLLRDIERTIRAQVPVKEHELGLKGVAQLAPTFGWNPMGKDKPQGAKPHHRGQKPNRNHGSGNGQPKQGKPHGERPQGAKPQQPKREAGKSGGSQAPKRTGGGSWMTDLGKRQA